MQDDELLKIGWGRDVTDRGLWGFREFEAAYRGHRCPASGTPRTDAEHALASIGLGHVPVRIPEMLE